MIGLFLRGLLEGHGYAPFLEIAAALHDEPHSAKCPTVRRCFHGRDFVMPVRRSAEEGRCKKTISCAGVHGVLGSGLLVFWGRVGSGAAKL